MLIKRTLLLGTSFFVALLYGVEPEPFQGISFFSPRSQTTNAAQELIDDQHYLHQHELKDSHFFTATVAFYQSLHPEQLANIVFGRSPIVIDGSFIENREEGALLADYFGLSPSFKSIVEIDPKWRSVYIPFTFYGALDEFVHGMYVRICVPYVWNQSILHLNETIINDGTDTLFPARYMAPQAIAAPYTSFAQALQGRKTYGFVTQPLFFGKFKEEQSTQHLANITFDVGWNIILDYFRHFGLKIRTVTPNSTRPTGEFLYEPLAGNGHHWEFGFGINGHTLIWERDGDHELAVYLNLLVTHLFDAEQRRAFDIKRNFCELRFFSRYMLVKEFDESGAFTGNVTPLINHTTLPCKVNVALEFDGAMMLAYNYKHFTFDLGYNGWIRSKEKISLCHTIPNRRLGLKGIQNVVNEEGQLSQATQSTATIFGNNFAEQDLVVDPISPVFLNDGNIDLTSARSPTVFSHKLFTYLGYVNGKLHKCRSVQPTIGIGSEIEFQGINTSNVDIDFVEKLTLSQWSIFLKVGLLFD